MATGISIQIKNAKQIQNLFRQLPDSLKQVGLDLIKEEFTVAAKEAQSLASAHDYTGELSSGIRLEEVEGKYVYKSEAPHSAFAEFGTRSRYQRRAGFENWAKQWKGRKIHSGGTMWDRIKAWAAFRNIPEEYWGAIYTTIKRKGTNPIGPAQGGFFLPPYNSAKGRIVKQLKQLLPKARRRKK